MVGRGYFLSPVVQGDVMAVARVTVSFSPVDRWGCQVRMLVDSLALHAAALGPRVL